MGDFMGAELFGPLFFVTISKRSMSFRRSPDGFGPIEESNSWASKTS